MPNDTGPGGPSPNRDLLTLAADKAQRYVRNITERRVGPSESAVSALAELWEPFPSSPSDPGEVITSLDRVGSAATVAMTGGRYFGFVNGGMVPAAMAANWLAVAWNQNAALRVMSPIAAELEEIVLRWICEALVLPRECAGGLVTCATMANFTALVTARHTLLARAGRDVRCAADRSGRRRGSSCIDPESVEPGWIWDETRNNRGRRWPGTDACR